MTDNRDDILIRKFFEENMPEIEDRGFSDRVMRRLPKRTNTAGRIWAALCAVAGITFFILCRGWEYILSCFYDITAVIYTNETPQTRPLTLVVAVLVLATIAINNHVLSDE